MNELLQEVESKLQLSEEALLLEIGKSGAKSAIAPDLIRRGKEIYENLKEKLTEQICTNETVIDAYKSVESNGKIALVAALLDCVSGFITGVSPVVFCVLLVKEGLKPFCNSYWAP